MSSGSRPRISIQNDHPPPCPIQPAMTHCKDHNSCSDCLLVRLYLGLSVTSSIGSIIMGPVIISDLIWAFAEFITLTIRRPKKRSIHLIAHLIFDLRSCFKVHHRRVAKGPSKPMYYTPGQGAPFAVVPGPQDAETNSIPAATRDSKSVSSLPDKDELKAAGSHAQFGADRV
ncbi:hypothetical protein diail_2979 [Diaporthe ilicicola]|nr:hypothetical protein diail_2979 [Diaporthe ilicicola]